MAASPVDYLPHMSKTLFWYLLRDLLRIFIVTSGTLAADNELTACRASGISNLAMTWPAIPLGLLVALVSLLFLSFIVPVFPLKVEKVIYSNIAQLIANKITRTHESSYGRTSIFAQAAEVRPAEGDKQVVDLF